MRWNTRIPIVNTVNQKKKILKTLIMQRLILCNQNFQKYV